MQVGDDRGSAPVELVLMSGVFFVFVAAILFAGRMNVESAQVEGAARTAARTISLARDPYGAVAAAHDAASDAVGEGSSLCPDMDFPYPDIDLAEETVTVTVTCTVDLSQAALVEVPGELPVTATATEVLDRYREEPAP